MAAPDFRRLPGERVLWSGQPGQGIRLSPQDAYLIPFSLMWGGFALFWNVGVWTEGAPLFFRLWGLPFLVAGFYVAVGRFAHDAWLRARTYYAVTDRRIVICRGDKVRSIDRTALPLLDMEERGDGSGTIWFGERESLFGRGQWGIWTPSTGTTPRFQCVPHVRSIYELISAQPVRAA